jgi:hypothetical protein
MRECEHKGTRAIFIYPCLTRSNYEINKAMISRIEAALKAGIPGIPPLKAADFVYDDRYFFNTVYHMNAEGRTLRTEKMITVLDAWMRR